MLISFFLYISILQMQIQISYCVRITQRWHNEDSEHSIYSEVQQSAANTMDHNQCFKCQMVTMQWIWITTIDVISLLNAKYNTQWNSLQITWGISVIHRVTYSTKYSLNYSVKYSLNNSASKILNELLGKVCRVIYWVKCLVKYSANYFANL